MQLAAQRHGSHTFHRSIQHRKRPQVPQCANGLEAAAIKSPLVALKEWAALIAALGEGKQTVLLRKGGIREGPFKAPASSFYLFPTSFHSEGRLLRPDAETAYPKELSCDPKAAQQIVLSLAADLTGAWLTNHGGIADLLQEYHVMGPDFLEKRMRWRKEQPITVLELKCMRLDTPLVFRQDDAFYGCFSWVDLQRQVQGFQAEGQYVLGQDEFREKQAGVRAALQKVDATPVQ